MDLTTQCPQCGETFRASLEQLQLRKGYVRCIACAHIFDGYEAVVPASASRAPAGAADSRAAHTLDGHLPESSVQNEAHHHVSLETPPDPQESHHRDQHDPQPFQISDTPRAAVPAGSGRHDPVIGVGDDDEDDAEPYQGGIYVEPRAPYGSTRAADIPEFLDERPRRMSGMGHGLWWFLCLAGLLLLAAQAVYMYRMQLADNAPVLRPVLERLCLPLGCTVDYPRKLGQLSVISSSLRVRKPAGDAPEQGSTLMLQMTLRNAAERPQQWPSVTLDLTDFSGAVVVRKQLTPPDYLPQDKRGQPFPARSELDIQLPLDVQDSTVNGYQLNLFFP